MPDQTVPSPPISQRSYRTLIVLAPLLVYSLELGLAFRTTLFRRRIFRAGHDAKVREWRTARANDHVYPSVDVYLPTAGEPLDILDNTYGDVGSIEWPGELTFYVLDDAGRQEVHDLANLHGFQHIHRESRAFKKAGNLNHAFKITSGDIILLFDADFVPPTGDSVRAGALHG